MNLFAIWALLAISGAAFAQGSLGKATGKVDPRPFDPHDLSGVWWGNLYGFAKAVPTMTPAGQARFDANKPAYGLALGSAEANAHTEEHIGRRRAIPSALTNDPTFTCNPLGLIRLLFYAPAPMEMVSTPAKMLQNFEWTWDHREIWMDGRKLPDVDDYIARYNGYSVGRWDGNTLIVDTIGFDDKAWVDHFGYPLSSKARLEERWRRVNYNTIEVSMTLTDPETYTKPWVSDLLTYRLIKQDNLSRTWPGLVEDRCVQAEESEFNTRVRNPAGGVK